MEKPAFIWDLDGTLLDSYKVIVSSLHQACLEFGVITDEQEIYREVITHTVSAFLTKTVNETGLSFDSLKEKFSEFNDSGNLRVTLIKNAAETLAYLDNRGIPNYVFTHKGSNTEFILKNTGIYGFFKDIITGNDGFPKKPDPAAVNFLIDKHGLDRNSCFYVGDRTLDIDCAANAGIGSILYLPEGSPTRPTGKETFIIQDLLEIRDIIEQMK